jgi:uncharacterized protein YdgA (DUF945 family)
MNKKLVYALVGLGAVTVGVTAGAAISGRAVSAKLSEQSGSLKKLLPGLKLDEKLDSGVFSSTRTLTLRLGCAPLPGQDGSVGRTPPLEVRWRDRIQHGPGAWSQGMSVAVIDSELILPDAIAAQVKPVLGDKPPLTLHTRVSMNGSFQSEVSVPGFKLKPRSGEEVQFGGLHGRLTGRMPTSKGTLTYNWSEAPLAFRLLTADVNMDFDVSALDATGSVEVDPDKPSLFVPFDSVASIDAIKIKTTVSDPSRGAPAAFQVTFDKIKAESSSKLDKELFTTTTRMAGALDVNGIRIDKLEIGSALRRLHAPTYAKLTNELIALGFSCDKKLDDPSALLDQFAANLFDLLPHDPEYAVGPLALELAGKRLELSYSVGTRGVKAEDKSVPLAALLLQKGVARADAKAHLGLIDEAAKLASKVMAAADPSQAPPPGTPDPMAIVALAMVESFVKEGYLVREGDFVRGSVEAASGAITLNGKPFAMPDLGLGSGLQIPAPTGP